MSDEGIKKEIELICSFRQGDAQAFDALLLQYEPLFSSLLTAMSSGSDYAEMRLTMEDAFRDAAMKYDVHDETRTFGAYAKTAMLHRISGFRKDRKRHGFDALTENTADSFDLEEDLMKEEFFLLILRKMKEICSPFEYRVFLSYLEGDTPRQTAQRFRTDAKTVSNAKARALSKIRKNLSEFLL